MKDSALVFAIGFFSTYGAIRFVEEMNSIISKWESDRTQSLLYNAVVDYEREH